MSHYKICYCHSKFTLIQEYWGDLLIYSYRVYSQYTGGDILSFIANNNYSRKVHWDNLKEFHRRTEILEF